MLLFRKACLAAQPAHRCQGFKMTSAFVAVPKNAPRVNWGSAVAVSEGADLLRKHTTKALYAPDTSGNRPMATLDEALVEEIMQNHPITFHVETTCKEAARQLLAHDVSSAPVIDAHGKLLGVLTEQDLIWKGAGAPLDHTIIPPVYVGAFDLLISLRDSKQVQEEVDKILARTVGQAMTRNPARIGPNASLSQAAQMMLSKKVHSLPVVEETGKVIGVVTQHDILRGMVAEQLPLL